MVSEGCLVGGVNCDISQAQLGAVSCKGLWKLQVRAAELDRGHQKLVLWGKASRECQGSQSMIGEEGASADAEWSCDVLSEAS